MQLTNPLLHALLAACDQSYNPAPTQGQALAPYLDTPGGDPSGNYWPATWPATDLDGWTEVKRFDESGTGFGAVVYQKSAGNGKFDYIVALQGTRGPNAQDWHGNLTYGWEKWVTKSTQGGQDLMKYLLGTGDNGILSTTNQINFTGQSLGGALAQYAAYQYVDQRNNVLQKPVSSSDVSLTSFNGLGGLEALNKNYENDFGRPFTADLVSGVATAHYWITNDLVSALGGGHLNGHEYRLDFRAGPGPNGNALSIIDAHRIESGFYHGFNTNGADFSTAAQLTANTPLDVANIAAIGTTWANLFNNSYTGTPEATARLIAALMVGVIAGPPNEAARLSDAILDRMWASGQVQASLDMFAPAAQKAIFNAVKSYGPALAKKIATSPPALLTMLQSWLMAQMCNLFDTGTTSSIGKSDMYGSVVAQVTAILGKPEFASVNKQAVQDATTILNNHAGQSRQELSLSTTIAMKVIAMKAGLASVSPDAPNLSASLITAHGDEILQILRDDVHWAGTLASKFGQWAVADGESAGKAIAGFAAWVYQQAGAMASSTSDFVAATAKALASSVEGLFKSAGDAFADFTAKYGAGAVDWIAGMSDAARRQMIGDFLAVFGGQGVALDAAAASIGWSAFASALAHGGDLGKDAAQQIAILTGTDANPFADPAFDPNMVTIGLNLKQWQVKTFTVYLPFTADASGQKIHLKLDGSAASSFDFWDGEHGRTPLNNGGFDLTVAPGERQVTFSLLVAREVTASDTLGLSATLDDASGQATHVTHVEVSFNVAANENPPTDPVTTGAVTGQADTMTVNGAKIDVTRYGTLADNASNAIATANTFNIIAEGGGNNSIIGGTDSDAVVVLNGNNVISGGGGQDEFIAGNGDNRIYAGSKADLATAIAQAKTASASGQPGDFIRVLDGDNTLVGGTGNDHIEIGRGNNVVVTGPGDTTVTAGIPWAGAWDANAASQTDWAASWASSASAPWPYQLQYWGPQGGAYNPADVREGAIAVHAWIYSHGAGNDLPGGYHGNYLSGPYEFGIGNDTIFGGSGNDTFWLSNGDNYVDAGAGNDHILAGTGKNTIFSGAGDDTILGGGGNNYIAAESGDDLIVAEGGNSTIVGGSGNDTIYAGDAIAAWATSEQGNNLIEAGSGNTVIYGSGGHDTLLGGSGNDTLLAGDGEQYLEGGSGDNLIVGGAGNDTLVAGTGNDTLIAGKGNTTIHGGDGSDVIQGGSGINVLYAGDGGTVDNPTQVEAGSGDTTIYGGAGIDLIWGGSGTNVIYAGDGGTAGSFTQVIAGDGDTTVYGGNGIDHIFGGNGNDVLYAGDGGTADSRTFVMAGSGETTLVGGAGYSQLVGGAGHATYVLNAGGNTIIVNSKDSDTILFGADIHPTDLTVTAQLYADGSSALIVGTDSGTATIMDGLSGGAGHFRFADATTLNLMQLMQQANVVSQKFVGVDADLILSAAAGDVLVGGSGHDAIYGFGANDTLVGGSGVATLTGGGGNATYVADTGAQTTINHSTGTDMLQFGAGVHAADLKATSTTAADGSPVVTLQIGAGGAVAINGGAAGMLSQVSFADGSTTTLAQLLAQSNSGAGATTNPDDSTTNPDGSTTTISNDGHGNVTTTQFDKNGVKLSDSWTHADGSQGTDTFNVDGTRVGSASYADGASSTYADNGQGLVTTKHYNADGTLTGTSATTTDSQGDVQTVNYDSNGVKTGDSWTQPNGLSGSDVYRSDGSLSSSTANDGHGDTLTTQYDAQGILTGDNWTKGDGSHGSDIVNSDGSSAGGIVYIDGTSSTYTNDGHGNTLTILENQQGSKTGDQWTHADGSYGSDVFNADGSSSGIAHAPDGAFTTYTNDGHDDINTVSYDAQGKQIGATVAAANGVNYSDDGKDDVTLTFYDAQGSKVGDSWTSADGSHGSDTFNADGSRAGTSYQADGSYSAYADDGQGQVVTKYYGWNGSLNGSSVSETNGYHNTITSYSNAAGVKLKETWVHSDGSSGSDVVNKLDYFGALNLVAQGELHSSVDLETPARVNVFYSVQVSSNDYWVQYGFMDNNSGNMFNFQAAPQSGGVADFTFYDDVTDLNFSGHAGSDGSIYFIGNGWGSGVWQNWQITTTAQTSVTKTLLGSNGTHGTLKSDGRGNVTVIDYDAHGVKLFDMWLHNDGTGGMDTFNADGSSSGLSSNLDGSVTTYTDDGHGHVVTENDLGPIPKTNSAPPSIALQYAPPSLTQFSASGSGWGDFVMSNPDNQGGSYNIQYHSDGSVTLTHLDANGNLLSSGFVQTDPGYGATVAINGKTTAWTYDVAGVPTSSATDDGHGNVVTVFYDGQGHTTGTSIAATDSQSAVTTHLYDAAGQATGSSIKAAIGQGQVKTTTFDADGQLTGSSLEVSDGQGNSITSTYDAAGTLLSSGTMTVTGTREVTAASYDAYGMPTWAFVTTTDSQGVIRTNTYDAHGKLTGSVRATKDSAGNVTTSNYDATGALTGYVKLVSDGQNNTTITTFDAHGIKQRDNTLTSAGIQVSNSYHLDGASVRITRNLDRTYNITTNDGLGNVTTTDYGSEDLKLRDTWTRTDGSTGMSTFDVDGTATGSASYTDGTFSTYVRNGAGQITTQHYGPDGSTLTGTSIATNIQGNATTTNYDLHGVKLNDRWTGSDGSQGTDNFHTDGSISRMWQKADGAHGTATDDGKGYTEAISYDTNNNVTEYDWAQSDGNYSKVGYTYDATGFMTGDTYANSDGKYGFDIFNPDGTNSGTTYYADGSIITYTGDQNGDAWTKSDGSHGTDTWGAAGGTSTVVNPDGSYSVGTSDGAGAGSTTYFDKYGNKLSDTWYHADGTEGSDTFDVNHAPVVLTPVPNQAVDEGSAWSFQIPAGTFADLDSGDTLTYSVSQVDGMVLPMWLAFDANTGTLSGTPADDDIGTLNLKVTATDTSGLSVGTALNLTVNVVDTITTAVSMVLPAHVHNLTGIGSGSLTLTGNNLANVITANGGNDILQGGAGTDTLTDTAGNNVFNGGAGNDTITGGSGNEFIVGGTGNDMITTGTGADMIAFNRGDGADVVNASTGKDNTVSLGNGIKYADLLFKKSSNDLILVAGASDQITFKDWYLDVNNHSVAKLQVAIEGTTDYNAASANKINNKKVEQFDFDGLAFAFDRVRATDPSMTSWALSPWLLNFYLNSSDTAAIGGDLAYQYAKNGSLSNISMTPAQALLASTQFGTANQNLQATSALQDLSPRLL